MSQCRTCSAKCCQYFALQIDTPKTKADFDHLRWYLAHKKTVIFYERRKWFLQIDNPCKYLTKENMCSIYHKRPDLCRTHSHHDCEFHGTAYDHDLFFDSLEALDIYIKRRFNKKTKKKRC